MGNLPVNPPEKQKKNGAQAPDPSLADEKTDPILKVLIIEDTIELAEVVQVTLERLDLKVFVETHGRKALEVYNTEHPDLVLLDIALPDTTGWKVLDTMREQQKGGKGPIIIVITAYGDPANRLMGKLQGIYSYLIKPFTPDEVEKVVIAALNLKKPGKQ